MHKGLRRCAALVALAVLASCSSGDGAGRLTGDTSSTTILSPEPAPEGAVEPDPPAPTTVPAPDTTAAPASPATTAARRPATTGDAGAAGSGSPKVVVSATGVVLPVLGRVGGGYRVNTPCGASTVINGGTPVEGTVVLDPGHGGREPGAVGPNGTAERDVNLAVVNYAREALQAAGVGAVLTRTADYRMTLDARAQVVKALSPRAFVSVHHNAEPDGPSDRPGVETYYQVASAESKRLAGLVYEEVLKALSQYRIAWVADTDAGAKYRKNSAGDDYYGILRRTQGTPATLAELAFISNPAEEALLVRPDVQKVEGEAVARGVLRFLNTRDPGSGFTEPYPRESPAGPGGGSANCVDPPL